MDVKPCAEAESAAGACGGSSREEDMDVEVKPKGEEKDPHVRSISPQLVENPAIYETQFFQFTPPAFSDGIYNSLITYAWQFLEKSQLILKKEFPDIVRNGDINKASADIFPKLIKSFKLSFDRLETYICQNIFHVQDHVILPEDEIQEKYPNAQETEAELDEDIKMLLEKIRIAKYVNARLKQEISDVAKVQAELDKMIEQMRMIEKAASGHGDLGEFLGFLCGKAIELKRLLESVEKDCSTKMYKHNTGDSMMQELGEAC